MDTVLWQRLAALPADCAAMLALVVSVDGSSYRRPGAARLWVTDGVAEGMVSGGCLEADLVERANRMAPGAEHGQLVAYDLRAGEEDAWGLAAGCNGRIEVWLQPLPAGCPSAYRRAAGWLAAGHAVVVTTVLMGGEQWATAVDAPALTFGTVRALGAEERAFVDRREPAPRMYVFGTGPDAVCVAATARRVGFLARMLARGDDLAEMLARERAAAVVVMSHHLPSDRGALRAALSAGVPYVGALGPRERTLRMVPAPWPPALHGPVGLDLGAEGPEEIALAVVAEALAVLRGATGGFLRDHRGPSLPRCRR